MKDVLEAIPFTNFLKNSIGSHRKTVKIQDFKIRIYLISLYAGVKMRVRV
jgi:hypothetical protein